jgi:hypothetical protein
MDIKRVFSDSDTPMTSFVNLIKNNLKTNAMDSVNMVSDSIDYGSSVINIKELYKTRSRPDMVFYEDTETMSNLELEGRMMTVVTTRDSDEAIKEATKIAQESRDIFNIRMTDSDITMGCKMLNAFIASKDERIKATMNSSFVFYTPKTERTEKGTFTYHCYSTIKNAGFIKVDAMAKKIYVSIFLMDQLSLRNNNMLDMMLNDMIRYTKMKYTLTWMTTNNKMVLSNREIFFTDRSPVSTTVRLVLKSMKWSINAEFSVKGLTFNKKIVELTYGLDYKTFKASISELSLDYMTLLSNKTMTIRQMNKMFLELGWIKDDPGFFNNNDGTKKKVYSTKETMEIIQTQSLENETFEQEALEFFIPGIDLASDYGSEDEDEDNRETKINLEVDLPFNEIEKAMVRGEEDVSNDDELFGKNLKLEKLMNKIMSIVLKGRLMTDMRTIRFFAKNNVDRVGNLVFNTLRYLLSEFNLNLKLVEMIFFMIYKNLMLEIKVPSEFTVLDMDLVDVESKLNMLISDGYGWPVSLVKESLMASAYGF